MRKNILIAISGLILLSLLGGYYFSPYATAFNMRQAVLDGNAIVLSNYVNFPSLKESLKASINATLAKEVVTSNSGDKSSSALGAVITGAFASPMIDALVTPENLALLMQKGNFSISKENSNREVTMGYEGLDKFAISIKVNGDTHSPLILLLHREGTFAWKLSSVRLPAKLLASSNVEVIHQVDRINEAQSNHKPTADAQSPTQEIEEKTTEPIEEIIASPPLPAAQIEESPPLGHCKGGEVTYFSCQVKSSRKFISICGSKFFDDKLEKRIDGAWIQYRFGELNKTELVYPLEKIGSVDKFTAEYQKHYQMQSYSLGFKIGNNEYNIDIDESAEREFYGISLTTNGKEIEIPCKDYPQSSDQATSSNNFRGLVIKLNNSN